MDDTEIIAEFLIESTENLARLDLDLVQLEQQPGDSALLASIFRTIHTIKGTCGFLNFRTLERITHQAENILSQVRNGDRQLTPALITLTLETVDAVRAELTSIELTTQESGETYNSLVERQKTAALETQPAAVDQATPATGKAKAPNESAPRETGPAEAGKPERAFPGLEIFAPEQAAHQQGSARPETAPIPQVRQRPSEGTNASGQKAVSVGESTVRVDVGLLNKLMNLVGELVLARNQILQFNAAREDARLGATSQRLNLITRELQESVMKTRMQPIGTVWNKLPRVVRDLAISCGKQINLEMEGAGTELDRTIIEAIKDPLTHIVRNSCDHGIEDAETRLKCGKTAHGTLRLRAFHEGGNVNIDIADDGGGIDPQKVKLSAINKGLLRPEQAERLSARELVNLVFLPGFSTAGQVSNISGRGVGMDVVKTNIEKTGGTVDLISRVGSGTTVKIKIPLTLAIIPGLVVTSGGERFVIPQVNLLDLVRLNTPSQIERIHGAPVYRRRGNLLPLVYLNETLRLQNETRESEVTNIVVLQAEERQFGLVVDGINDTQEIVVKPLGKQLKSVAVYAGATIMGDGKVALILDVAGIARVSSVLSQSRTAGATEKQGRPDAADRERQMLLLFSAGEFRRLAVPLSLVGRLEEIPLSEIERAGDGMVIQYRGAIIALVPLAAQLGRPAMASEMRDPAQVVVFADGNRRIGLIVDQILDIVEDEITIKKTGNRPGLLGSAVVGNKVTDFLDVHAIIQGFEGGWFGSNGAATKPGTILLAEGSPFVRGLMRTNLEMAGHRVIEAADAREALDKLAQEKPERDDLSAAAVALDLPGGSALELLEAMRRQPGLKDLPVFALTNGRETCAAIPADSWFTEHLSKFDRQGMLESLDRLMRAVEPLAEGRPPVPAKGQREEAGCPR